MTTKAALPPWPGDCFSRAAREMFLSQDNPDIRLVHAEVPDSYNPGRWVIHAWMEIPATFTMQDDETGEKREAPGIAVVDTAQPDPKAHIVPRDWYYERCTPRNIKRYTFAEAIERGARHKHDGPWPD